MTLGRMDAPVTAPIEGLCPTRFEGVRQAFAANFAQHDDVGASLAVCIDGEMVVDIWGGWTDETRQQAWSRDTIVNTFSSTKTATALCALLLADRGELDVDAPVRKYWPEFSSPDVTPRHCLAHTAGLPGWDEPLTMDELFEGEKPAALLARQTPWWKPGSAWAYHSISQGVLVGELVRRITGQSTGKFLEAELAGPLGADFHIGTGPQFDARIAPVIPGPPDPPAPEGSLMARMVRYPVFTLGAALSLPWRRCELPAGNGFGNARALARLQSLLACEGEVGGKRLMSREGARAAASPSWEGPDLIMQSPTGFGLGFALHLGPLKFGKGTSCYWGGAGGSLVVVDYEARMSFAYVMNRLKAAPFGDPRNMGPLMATYAALNAAG
ncbi:MAG: serine hydrolase domain-containing protein [Caulobacterales bacterium]